MNHTMRTITKRGSVAGCLLAIALFASGCTFFLPNALEHQAAHPDSRPWWCHSEPGGGHGHDAAAEVPMKGMLSWEDCLSLSASLDDALAYALQYPTRAEGEAAGLYPAVNYATGMGTHHGRLGELDSVFDPTRPEFLQYAGNTPDAPLVGMSWFVRTDGPPPEGFPGNNDMWHSHAYLCMRGGQVIGDGLTNEQCEARGGVNTYFGDFWMLHAWIVPGMQHHPDVFINHHPCLKPGGVAPLTDECWTMSAMSAGHGG